MWAARERIIAKNGGAGAKPVAEGRLRRRETAAAASLDVIAKHQLLRTGLQVDLAGQIRHV